MSGLKAVIVVLSLLLFLAVGEGYAQSLPPGQYTTKNKKAIKYLEEGKRAFEVKNDVLAEKCFLKALEADENFIEAALGLANLHQLSNHHTQAIQYYKRAIEINPKFYSYGFYYLSESLLATGQYQE